MSNPYLPNPFNENDYGLTIFKPDMVLTHEQLNTLFGYLIQQDARTRTQLIGVGVVCGLQPRVVGASVIVSRGCGVTTEGDLISFPSARTYTQMLPYRLADHVPYRPFQDIDGLQLWELFPAEYADDQPKEELSLPFLNDKVVMLYLESQVKPADNCTGVACDNQGDRFQNRLHVLLVRRSDATRLIDVVHRQAAAACAKLPRLKSRRVGVDALPYAISHKRFQAFVQSLAETFSKQLTSSYDLIAAVMNPVYGDKPPIDEWRKALQITVKESSTNANIQYVYDWLKDLFDAYEEFRLAACCWLTVCLPDESWFPKHLLLGELRGADCQPELRHYFLRSPAVLDCQDGRQKAIWLHKRIGQLIEGFKLPALRPSFDTLDIRDTFATNVRTRTRENDLVNAGLKSRFLPVTPPRITPSYPRTAPLGDRAMPFYYDPSVRDFWSYERSKRCQQDDVLSFHLPANAPAYVNDPFNFDIDKFAFYRIEAILNEDVDDIVQILRDFRKKYNLAFSLVALRADEKQSLYKGAVPAAVNDLERDYQNIVDDIRDMFGSLTPIEKPAISKANRLKKRMVNNAEKIATRLNLGEIKTTESYLNAVTRFEGELKSYILKPIATAPTFPLESIQLDYTEFAQRRDAVLSSLAKREPARVVDGIIQKLATLDKIKKAYDGRLLRSTFGAFLARHPGLEHGAGVPRGGTFVLVYRDVRDAKSKTTVQQVVADFCLPYLIAES